MSGVLIDAKPYYPDVAEAVGKLAERDLRDNVLPTLLRALFYVDVDKLIRWVDGAALTRLLSERLTRQALAQMLHLTAGASPEAEDKP